VQLFAREWMFTMRNFDWALECLALELRALEFFASGSGLDPSDGRLIGLQLPFSGR
jgi:hypothetical protein